MRVPNTLLLIALLAPLVRGDTSPLSASERASLIGAFDSSQAVVHVRIQSVTFVRRVHQHYIYRLNAETIQVFKGSASNDVCYYQQTESKWENPPARGDEQIAILWEAQLDECGYLEPGALPATEKYRSLFQEAPNDDD